MVSSLNLKVAGTENLSLSTFIFSVVIRSFLSFLSSGFKLSAKLDVLFQRGTKVGSSTWSFLKFVFVTIFWAVFGMYGSDIRTGIFAKFFIIIEQVQGYLSSSDNVW